MCILFILSCSLFSNIFLKGRHAHILKFGIHVWCGITKMQVCSYHISEYKSIDFFLIYVLDILQMWSLVDYKQGICCNIYGLGPFLMLQLMLFKALDQLKFVLLVFQRYDSLPHKHIDLQFMQVTYAKQVKRF